MTNFIILFNHLFSLQSLGNSDLERGSSKLTPFIENIGTTVLASNVILNSNIAKQKIQKSILKDIQGIKVGIIGYLTPKYGILDSTDSIEYIDEVIAMQEEVQVLKAQGAKIIIALGHSEIGKDIQIALEVDGVDLVINGHDNSFFSNGTNAESEFKNSIKSTIISQKSGKQVPVIRSYAYNKYLGKIVVLINRNGKIVDYRVDPLLLDNSIPQDSEILQIIKNSADDVMAYSNVEVGKTVVVLDGETCGLEECNFGNLVLDSMVFHYASKFEGEYWTDSPIAIINGGALSRRILPRNTSITQGELLSSIPENDVLVTVTLNGTLLKQVLEHSVSHYTRSNPSGQLLQFSGIRATFDLAKDPYSRLISAVVRCWDCLVPQFFAIDEWKDYKILMPSTLAKGGYGYSMLVSLPREELNYDVVTCVADYIKKRSPVYPEVAERLVLLNQDSAPDSAIDISSNVLMLIPALSLLLNLV